MTFKIKRSKKWWERKKPGKAVDWSMIKKRVNNMKKEIFIVGIYCESFSILATSTSSNLSKSTQVFIIIF